MSEPIDEGKLLRNLKPILLPGGLFALLTAYIYSHASAETFVVYIVALILWASLFGYCLRIRAKQQGKPSTLP